jgi:glutathione S-transferase
VKLYAFPGAPSPLRVELMMRYQGIALETQTVDLRGGAHFESDYRQINPRCTVPALECDDGSCLTDAVSIALYLDSRFPERPVFGTSDLERAHVVGWTHRIFCDGFIPTADIVRNTSERLANRAIAGPDEIPQLPALAERGRLRLGCFLHMLDGHVAARAFIVGDRLSQADIDAHVVLHFATTWLNEPLPPDCTRLPAWRDRVAGLLS